MPKLTVRIADAGTILVRDRARGRPGTSTSTVGHIWYSIDKGDGSPVLAFGFGRDPASSLLQAPFYVGGKPSGYDDSEYQPNPGKNASIYAFTIEISQKQYDQLLDFGNNPGKYGFDTSYYSGLAHSCIDFVWTALGTVGIYKLPQPNRPDQSGQAPLLLPSQNIEAVVDAFTRFQKGKPPAERITTTPDRSSSACDEQSKVARMALADQNSRSIASGFYGRPRASEESGVPDPVGYRHHRATVQGVTANQSGQATPGFPSKAPTPINRLVPRLIPALPETGVRNASYSYETSPVPEWSVNSPNWLTSGVYRGNMPVPSISHLCPGSFLQNANVSGRPFTPFTVRRNLLDSEGSEQMY